MPFPSDEQSVVISHRGDPLIVVAGPGTGKTKTLVERMIQLLREDQSREVTFITFTKSSRRDTEIKLSKAFGDAILEQPPDKFPRTSTLHGYAKRLLHSNAKLIDLNPAFSILTDSKDERSIVISELARDLDLAIPLNELSKGISRVRATREWPSDFSADGSTRVAILDRFEVLLRLYKTLEMEGVVLATCEILQSSETLLPKIYLQVDEYQDLTPVDQEFVDLFSSHQGSEVVAVGDDAQSIYGFRHANFQGLTDLWKSKDWKKIQLQDSFRLPGHILNAALDLIGDRDYLGARINSKPSNDKNITVLQCTKDALQIEAIASDIRSKLAIESTSDDAQLSYRNFLVLCPTGNQVGQVVSQFNDSFQIPAHTLSKPKLPDDYWTILLFLRMAASSDPLAIRQWLPILGFSSEEIFNIRDGAIKEEIDFFTKCLSVNDKRIIELAEKIEQVRAEHLQPTSLLELLANVDGIQIPSDFLQVLEVWTADDGDLPSIGSLVRLVYQHLGILDSDEVKEEKDMVLVTTMHSAKGLEAKFVYCAWMNSIFMPLPGQDIEEQRRILYVALTRAKNDVILTFPERYDDTQKRLSRKEELSSFLVEIKDHLSIVRVKAALVRKDPLPWHKPGTNSS